MDHRIIKYYAGELSKEERKALLQEAFSNQETEEGMIKLPALAIAGKTPPTRKKKRIIR